MLTAIKPGKSPSYRESQENDGFDPQGLTPEQITLLAQKVYALLLEEIRLESERHGGIRSR